MTRVKSQVNITSSQKLESSPTKGGITAENGSETEITDTFALLQNTRFTSLPSHWNAKGSRPTAPLIKRQLPPCPPPFRHSCLQDLPHTPLCAILCHREAQRTAAQPQRHRFFLRKGIRIVYQMICKKTLFPDQTRCLSEGQIQFSFTRFSLLGHLEYRCMFCFTSKNPLHYSNRLWCRTFILSKTKNAKPASR